MRHLLRSILVATLSCALLAAPAALASHGDFVHMGILKSEPTGYVVMSGDLFLLDLDHGDRVDATVEILRINYNSAHSLARDHLPYEIGLHLFVPNQPARLCHWEDEPHLNSADTKHRSGVAAYGGGEGSLWVTSDFFLPPGSFQYRLTVSVTGGQGAESVSHAGSGTYVDPTPPTCHYT